MHWSGWENCLQVSFSIYRRASNIKFIPNQGFMCPSNCFLRRNRKSNPTGKIKAPKYEKNRNEKIHLCQESPHKQMGPPDLANSLFDDPWNQPFPFWKFLIGTCFYWENCSLLGKSHRYSAMIFCALAFHVRQCILYKVIVRAEVK